DGPISCSFTVVDLVKAEPFEALSYCWGSVAADRPIFCHGQPFRPTENLYAALKQLRLTSRARYMWIDAICINQNSILERNQQVPLMRQIYHKAKQVIVWLGGEDDTTALALATMENIFQRCCSLWYGYDPKTCTNALQVFFRRPWFSRVWVIQEVQGCPHIIM
ncbi:hypothetical protein OIDMADRAFT_92771, partial [Oidiodendron maius Zn]